MDIEITRRPIPDRLRYLADQLEDAPVVGRVLTLAVALALRTTADEMTEVRHLQDEMNTKFQDALHALAEKCSQCGQPLPGEASEG